MFSGDSTKVVMGFCITGCAGQGTGLQAAAVMSDLAAYFPCNGGAFFWVAADDTGGSWSSAVAAVTQSSSGCSNSPSTQSPTSVPTYAKNPPTTTSTDLPTNYSPPSMHPVSTSTDPPTHAPFSLTYPPTKAPIVPQELVANANPRCGISEMDSRERCNPSCVSNGDCPSGQWCWGPHQNYCDDPNFQPFNWVQPMQSNVYYRCGKSEVDARSFCKQQCIWATDCITPGETCYAVNTNYCGSAVAS